MPTMKRWSQLTRAAPENLAQAKDEPRKEFGVENVPRNSKPSKKKSRRSA
jgi:hypothetical protein